jgi:glucose/mannose-6-phosphate isomerase
MTTMDELIRTLPDQLRWAAAVEVPPVSAASEALVVGMGGSGIAGTIASVIAEGAGRRVGVHKSYGLPGWVSRHRPLVVAVSHSGNTEETLSSVAAAREEGLDVAAVATGGRLAESAAAGGFPVLRPPPGPQPRAAVGYLTGGALRMLEGAGILPPQSEHLEEAAGVVESLLTGPGPALAADLAEALERRVVVVYGGSGVPEVAANRWKTQINENGKAIAFWSVLPELDHNEIVGWTAWPRLSRDQIGIVWLRDEGEHPKVALRSRITRELIEGTTTVAGEVHSTGSGPLARLFSLMVVGDLVSVAIAERAGADPMPVDVIEDLKKRLAQEET